MTENHYPEEYYPEDYDNDDSAGQSWRPVDLATLLASDYDPPRPTVGAIEGDGCLLYAGSTNLLFGDSGGGKTFFAVWAAAEEMRAGRDVLFLDWEDSPLTLAARLEQVGVTRATMVRHLIFIRPEEKWNAAAQRSLAAAVEGRKIALAIVDSVGEAMAADGVNSNSDDEVARWFRGAVRFLADGGAAVLLLDHVPKGSGDSGRNTGFSIGSQRKRAAITGAAYYLQTITAPSKLNDGRFKLIVRKDRHGTRQHGSVACVVEMNNGENGSVQFHVYKPEPKDGSGATPSGKTELTWYMDKISRYLEGQEGAVSKSSIVKGVGGGRDYILDALQSLVERGHVVTEVVGQSHLCRSAKPYRDPRTTKETPEGGTVEFF